MSKDTTALLYGDTEPISVTIVVAPNVVNSGSQGELVAVHTDIPYSLVKGASVTLNGIAIDWWKSDDRGYSVAKYVLDGVDDARAFWNRPRPTSS